MYGTSVLRFRPLLNDASAVSERMINGVQPRRLTLISRSRNSTVVRSGSEMVRVPFSSCLVWRRYRAIVIVSWE